MKIYLYCIVAALLASLAAFAVPLAFGDCHAFFNHSYVAPQVHHQAYVAPVKVVTPIYYAIGYGLQAAAQVEQKQKYAQKYDDYQEYLEWKAFKAGKAAAEQQQQTSAGSIVSQKCAACHGTALAAPKGGLYLEGGNRVPAASVVESLRRISLPDDDPDRMPPPAKEALKPEEKGALMEELLQLSE